MKNIFKTKKITEETQTTKSPIFKVELAITTVEKDGQITKTIRVTPEINYRLRGNAKSDYYGFFNGSNTFNSLEEFDAFIEALRETRAKLN